MVTSTALRWIELPSAQVADHPDVVAEIRARRLDGVTVTGVFDPSLCARAVAAMEADPDEHTWAMFGSMLGRPLPEYRGAPGAPEHRSAYLAQAEHWSARYRDAFGFDPYDRVVDVLGPLAGDLEVRAPVEDGRRYNPGNVRWYQPGSGGLPAHVGNEFDMHDDPSMAHLRTTTVTRDFLSWFVVLQPPESGGALSVFDLLHEQHRPAQAQWDEKGRVDDDFDDRPALQVAPAAGDLVLFGGGWRWHRVDQVGGHRARVTYGGFAGLSLDGRALHLWF